MGIEENAAGNFPQVERTAYVHPSAVLAGRVRIGSRVFIGPQAAIRADEPGPDGVVEPIVIGDRSNVQDCVVVHALGGTGVEIGTGTSLAHAAVVHGPCKIGADCFVGFNSVVFNATLGDGVVVMHQALVEGVTVPPGLCIPSMTAVRCEEDVRRLAPATPDMIAFARKVSQTNIVLAEVALTVALTEE